MAVLATSACSGPKQGLDADVKAIGVNVFFGPPAALAPAAPSTSISLPAGVAPVSIPPSPPVSGAQPAPPPVPTAVAPPACPKASPVAYPAAPATITGPSRPPV